MRTLDDSHKISYVSRVPKIYNTDSYVQYINSSDIMIGYYVRGMMPASIFTAQGEGSSTTPRRIAQKPYRLLRADNTADSLVRQEAVGADASGLAQRTRHVPRRRQGAPHAGVARAPVATGENDSVRHDLAADRALQMRGGGMRQTIQESLNGLPTSKLSREREGEGGRGEGGEYSKNNASRSRNIK